MAKWAHIKLDPVVWEELPRNGDGARVLSCRNYDPETKHRYRWRFNGSSILPKQIEVRRGRLVFNRSLDAYRNLFAGEYSCCIHESLGKACYAQQLQIGDPPQQIGLDLSEGNTLYAKVGNSYDIRLTNAKEHDEVQCKFNKEAVPGNVLALNHKEKKGKHYQLRIRHFSEENVGSYECTLRLGEKHELFMKEFVATLEAEPATSSSCSLLIKSVLLIAFIVIQQCN
ncbi:hypothetical protein Y032_0115g469 [Ancylostoma ceylanicum]|nr:hypothetical protein Y032_0115g469 [Ancylostoma ceylanicum]